MFQGQNNHVLRSRSKYLLQKPLMLPLFELLFIMVVSIVFLHLKPVWKLRQQSVQGKFFLFSDCRSQHTRTCFSESALWWYLISDTLKWQRRCQRRWIHLAWKEAMHEKWQQYQRQSFLTRQYQRDNLKRDVFIIFL